MGVGVSGVKEDESHGHESGSHSADSHSAASDSGTNHGSASHDGSHGDAQHSGEVHCASLCSRAGHARRLKGEADLLRDLLKAADGIDWLQDSLGKLEVTRPCGRGGLRQAHAAPLYDLAPTPAIGAFMAPAPKAKKATRVDALLSLLRGDLAPTL